MTLPSMWITVTLAVILGLNLAATLEVLLSPFHEQRERLTSLLLIWLLPVAGAVLCLRRAWRNHHGLDRRPDGETISDAADLAGVPQVERSRLKRSRDGLDDGGDDE